ncbi:MAG: hypothetical protein Q8P95_02360, partial [bacterium]|nr:hypothetical protein [bacterium]
MPDDGSSPKTSRLEKSDQPKKGLEVGEFADLARREYQNLKKEDLEAKEPAALYQEAADFVKNAIGEVTSKFREIESGFKKSGDLPEKISTAVAGGLTLLSMGKKIFETAVGKITEIGNWLGEKLGQVAQKSLNRVLDIVLGNKELSKLLSKKLKGKIDYAELFRVWMQDGNKGVGKFLLEKVQAGEIEVEK